MMKHFSTHQTSQPLQEKVQGRLAQTADDADCDAAYRELWDSQAASPVSDEQVDKAYQQLENRLFCRRQQAVRIS